MKTPFKSILVSALLALTTVFSIAWFSCNRDKCKSIVCANHGVCNYGTCVCPSGFQGTNCETVSRLKFIGNWSVFEKGTITNAAQYPITISPSNTVTDVVITNFYNYFVNPIKGYVIHDTLYIPNQQLEGKIVFGTGYITSNNTYGQYGTILMNYEVIDTATNIPNDFGFYGPDLSQVSTWNK